MAVYPPDREQRQPPGGLESSRGALNERGGIDRMARDVLVRDRGQLEPSDFGQQVRGVATVLLELDQDPPSQRAGACTDYSRVFAELHNHLLRKLYITLQTAHRNAQSPHPSEVLGDRPGAGGDPPGARNDRTVRSLL